MKAMLFDHDGVLADSESAFFAVTRDTFAEAGFDLDGPTWARCYLGHGWRSAAVARAIGVPAGQVDALIERRNRRFRRRLREGIALRAGVRETLAEFRGRVRLAIVTGCPRRQMEAIHARGDFLAQFDCVITSDDCERQKPHPEPYLKAMDRLALGPRDCLAVEDSPRGLAAAVSAGLRCVLVPTELTDRSMCHGAWRVLSAFDQLTRLVGRVAGTRPGATSLRASAPV